MDKLAVEGTWLRNAFVTTPISAVSRASILTGMYERTHGYTFQHGPLKQKFLKISYPVKMKENGYYIGFFGKLGVTCNEDRLLFDKADFYINVYQFSLFQPITEISRWHQPDRTVRNRI